MSISSFARLGASGLALALGLFVLAGANPADAASRPGQAAAARSATTLKAAKVAKRARIAKAKAESAAPGGATADADESAMPKPGVTWTSAEPDDRQCGRSRRKLWQAGEGWLVKTVTVCR